MDGPDIAGALHDTMWLLIKLGAPLLVAALVTGLVISLIQAVTQINEPTLVGFALGLMDRLVALGGQ
jgi:flagellar biosynthetic protein FliQ